MDTTKEMYGVEVQSDGLVRVTRTRNGSTICTPALTPKKIQMIIEGIPSTSARMQALRAFRAIYGAKGYRS
jgi:hypothetical protein